LLFELEPAGEAETRRRVLAHWQRGATLHLLAGDRWLLQLMAPKRVHAESCVATPLVRHPRGHLLAAPFTASEIEGLGISAASVVYLQGGVARAVGLRGLPSADPAAWLSLEAFQVVGAVPLAAARSVEPPSVALPAAARGVREVLGAAVPAVAPERDAMLDALLQTEASSGPQTVKPRAVVTALARVHSAWRRWLARLRRRPKAAAGSRAAAAPSAAASPGRPSAWRRMLEWLKGRVAQALWRPLRLDQKHARYLQDMLEMFDRGDLYNALRHAIPLSDERSQRALRTAFASPKPRTDLNISLTRAPAASTIGLANDVHSLVRAKYERAARTLEAQQRIDEAAFVWAELLGEVETAVALLERSGQLRKAAQLAETGKLAAGLVVRLWFLARDEARAVAIARAYGAFADAIARLEASARYAHAARQLRLHYGDALAKAGDYSGAVDVLWPVDEARMLAASFLLRALEVGGAQSGRALARMLAVGLEPEPTLIERVRMLAHDGTPQAALTRLAFAHALLTEQPGPARLRVGARAVFRALLADASRGHVAFPPKLQRTLLNLLDDAVLSADLPAQGQLAGRAWPRAGRPEQRVDAGDRGSVSVHDAVLLPDGRVLVALGEMGLRVYRADLRSHTPLFQPAQRVVINPEATRAIALAQRGRIYKLSRIDLHARRAQAWCDAEIDQFAKEFDGARWFIAAADALLAIDVTADEFQALWRVERVTGRGRNAFADISASPDKLELLEKNGSHGDYWFYDLRSLQLRAHRQVMSRTSYQRMPFLRRLRPGTGEVVFLAVDNDGEAPVVVLCHGSTTLELGALTGFLDQIELEVRRDWAAIAVCNAVGYEVVLVSLSDGQIVLRFALEGTSRLRLRLAEHSLLIADDLGRVRALSLMDGRVLCDLRVSV
jgi:hypothetical protein